MSKYKIEIKTCDEYRSGTDSNIFIVMKGYHDISREYRLNGMINGNAFERNQTDTVTIDTDDLGDIYELQLRSDCKYPGSDWRVDNIKIFNETTNNTSKFVINRWITNKNSHTFYDMNLPAKDSYKIEEINAYGDAVYNVPANTQVSISDEKTEVLGYDFSKADAFEINTSTTASTEYKSETITACVQFVLNTRLNQTKTEEILSKTTHTCKQDFKFPVCDIEKKYSKRKIIRRIAAS